MGGVDTPEETADSQPAEEPVEYANRSETTNGWTEFNPMRRRIAHAQSCQKRTQEVVDEGVRGEEEEA